MRFIAGDDRLPRQARDVVAASHVHAHRLTDRSGRADLDLDALGGLLADGHVVGLLHVVHDGLIEVIASNAH